MTMWKILLMWAALSGAIACCALTGRMIVRQELDRALHPADGPTLSVLCIGDSITSGWPHGHRYSDYLEGFDVANSSAPMKSTEWIAATCRAALAAHDYSHVVVCAGANDFDLPAEDYERQMLRLLCDVYQDGAKPIVLTIHADPSGKHGPVVDRLNPVIRRLPCVVVDYAAEADSSLLADEIHPTEAGARRMAVAVAEAIRQ